MSVYLKIGRLAKIFAVDKERITKALGINIGKKSIKTDFVCEKLKIEPTILETVLRADDTLLKITQLKSFVTAQTGLTPEAINQVEAIGQLWFDPAAIVSKTPYFSKKETSNAPFLAQLRQQSKKINQTVQPETIDTGFGNLLAEF